MKNLILITSCITITNVYAVGCDLSVKQVQFLKENTNITINKNPYNSQAIIAEIKANNTFFQKFPNGELRFRMNFSKNTWEFTNSVRNYKNGVDTIFGNEITSYLVSQANIKFPEIVTFSPYTLIRSGIKNPTTLKTLGRLGPDLNGSPKFLDTFLKETGNGKHTRRVLEDFDLKPTSAKFEDFNYEEFFQYYNPVTDSINLDLTSLEASNIVVDVFKPWRPWK